MTALDWNSALEKEAPVEFMHVPQPCACALSCLCCACRRPQRAATVRCLEWADVYSPSYRVLKDMGWHVATMQPACLPALSNSLSQEASVERLGNGLFLASLCLALSFINTVAGIDTSKKAGFSLWSEHCISTDECKENKEGFMKKLNLCVAMLEILC